MADSSPASTTDDGCRHLNEAHARIRELTEQRDALQGGMAWLRDFAESHEQYHTGFKHMRRFIEATDRAAVLGGVGEGDSQDEREPAFRITTRIDGQDDPHEAAQNVRRRLAAALERLLADRAIISFSIRETS